MKDVLLRLNLSLANYRGQCYDGAANMAGIRTGVATQISEYEQRAVFTHCYGHALNLAAADTMRQSKVLCGALDTVGEISRLLKYSPRRDSLFESIKSNIAPGVPGFRTLCPTRWTTKAASLQSVIDNYVAFQELWVETADFEARARIHGVEAQMMKFDFLFGLVLGVCILSHTDNLSKTLQTPKLNAADGQNIAELTCKTLERIRTDDSFKLFWEKVLRFQQTLGVSEPSLPRKRKAPKRLEVGTSEGFFTHTPEALFRVEYMEALDLVINFIRERFNQPGYRIYCNLENLLLKAASNDDYTAEFQFVLDYYGDDFDCSLLRTHLELFITCINTTEDNNQLTLLDIKSHVSRLSPGIRSSMSEVCKLIKILMVMPCTNAVSERSASALRRVKTYLRTTMGQSRLNHLMILHIHKESTDELSLESCLNEFVAGSEHRLSLFGQF